MVELWGIGVAAHEVYARGQQDVEAFKKLYNLSTQATKLVAVQTTVLDFIPKFENTMLLLQTFQKKSWPRFSIPVNYHIQRFTSSYVAPSLGPAEKQNADIAKVDTIISQNPGDEEVKNQGQTVIQLLGDVEIKNGMVDFTTSRQLQFLQA